MVSLEPEEVKLNCYNVIVVTKLLLQFHEDDENILRRLYRFYMNQCFKSLFLKPIQFNVD